MSVIEILFRLMVGASGLFIFIYGCNIILVTLLGEKCPICERKFLEGRKKGLTVKTKDGIKTACKHCTENVEKNGAN